MKLHKASMVSAFLSLVVLAELGLAAGAGALPATQRRPTATARAPLRESDVVTLLKTHVPSAEVGTQARRKGIDFIVSASVEQELRQAGADDALIQTLREIQPHGLVWDLPRDATSTDHGFVDVSNLVTEGEKHYLAFTGDDKHVRLASDASGTWKIYDVYTNSNVGNGANQWYVGLVVHGGKVYVPFVTLTGGRNVVAVAYSPNLQGAWSQAALFASDSSYANDPFGTLSGDTLLVSFDAGVTSKGSDDVFVASIPLSGLPAAGAPLTAPLPAAKVSDVSKVDDVPSGPGDDYAEIVPAAGGLDMAWQRALKTLVFAQGQVGGPGGTTWPPNPQLLHTAVDQAQQSLQLAAGQTTVIARFINNPNPSGPACCDVLATTNATGSWTTQTIGATNLALQRPGVAMSACGPSVAFQQAISGNQGRLTVATLEAGRWVRQSLAMNGMQPRLAVTPDGLDLTYLSGDGDLFLQHAKCYPPPARVHP